MGRFAAAIQRHPLLGYFILTCLISSGGVLALVGTNGLRYWGGPASRRHG